jgi:hypothetical protein
MWATVCKKCKKKISHHEHHPNEILFFSHVLILVDCAKILGFNSKSAVDTVQFRKNIDEEKLKIEEFALCSHFVKRYSNALTDHSHYYRDSVEDVHNIREILNNKINNCQIADDIPEDFLKNMDHKVLAGVLLMCTEFVLNEKNHSGFNLLKQHGFFDALYEWLIGFDKEYFNEGFYFHRNKVETMSRLKSVTSGFKQFIPYKLMKK